MELLNKRNLFSMAVLISTIFFKVTLSAQVDVDRKEQTVLPDQNVTYMCRVAVPLQYCRVEIPGRRTYNLNRGISNNDISYYGEGLDAGQCGFTIYRARDDNNGEIKCTLGIASEPQESIGTMGLVVARAPRLPELDLSRGADNLNVYSVDDNLDAICIVKDGRPVANISWFLDEEPIDYNELMMPIVYDLAKENLQTKMQNLTRKLRATDNGKFLRCVAYHPAYPGGQAEAKRRLDIKYAPLPQSQPIEEFGYEIGKAGTINVTVEANPKPIFTWIVDGESIEEEANDGDGKIKAQEVQDLGNGRYLASLSIAGISKQDTERDYILRAYNAIGNMEYKVKISTNPEPKGITKFFRQHVYGVYGVQVGVGIIAGIIIFILSLCIIIFITVFAKMTGRWCFSGGATVIDYTGDDNHHHHSDISGDGVDNPHHQVSSEYINGNDNNMIKKDEKINTAV